jgi:hypothetical protein
MMQHGLTFKSTLKIVRSEQDYHLPLEPEKNENTLNGNNVMPKEGLHNKARIVAIGVSIAGIKKWREGKNELELRWTQFDMPTALSLPILSGISCEGFSF